MSDKLRNVTRRSALVWPPFFLVLHSLPEAESSRSWFIRIKLQLLFGLGEAFKDAGFAVYGEETADLQPVRKRLGCRPISRLATPLRWMDTCWRTCPGDRRPTTPEERPAAIGLSVPACRRSPGWKGERPAYDVVLFGKTGRQPFMHFVGSEMSDER